MDPGARRRKGVSRAIAFINAISARIARGQTPLL